MDLGFVEVFRINKEGYVELFGIAHNHWGCATLIWHDLAKRYGVTKNGNILADKSQRILKKLWSSIGKGIMERWEEILLACTFDRVWVPKKLIGEASDAFIKFYGRKSDSTIVPTTRDVGILLKQMNDMFELSTIGAAFCMCSKVQSFWVIEGKINEDICRIKPYNIFSEINHTHGLYAERKHINIEEYIGNQESRTTTS